MKTKRILCLILAVLLGLGVLSPMLYVISSAAETPKQQTEVPKGDDEKPEPEKPQRPLQNQIDLEASLKEAKSLRSGQRDSKITRNEKVKLIVEVLYYGYQDKIKSPQVLSYDGKGSFALANDSGTQYVPEVIDVKVDPLKNYTLYTVELPVVYSGKGNSLSFDLRIDDTTVLKCHSTIPIAEEYVEKPDRDDDDDEDEKKPDPVTPYIIIESYTYGGDSVVAGNDFVLNLTLRNTSEYYTLQNIVMNVSTQGVLSMGSSSNTFYIESLHAGSTMNKEITINAGLNKVTDDKDANSVAIKFDFQYLNDHERRSGTSSENITIPVTFPDRFELSPPETGGNTVFLGEEWYIYVPMVNKGRSSVNNIMAYVECDGLERDQRQYIGNLQAGSESGIDFSFGFSEVGPKEGRIVVTYEDTNMNPKELSVPFTVDVQEMMFPEPEDFPGEGMGPDIPTDVPEEDGFPKAPIIVTAIVVAAISAYITVLKAKAKRSIFDDEEI